MHNGFVNVDNEKMSKSLGNFVTVHDTLRRLMASASLLPSDTNSIVNQLTLTEKAIHDAEVNLKYLKNTHSLPLTEEVSRRIASLS